MKAQNPFLKEVLFFALHIFSVIFYTGLHNYFLLKIYGDMAFEEISKLTLSYFSFKLSSLKATQEKTFGDVRFSLLLGLLYGTILGIVFATIARIVANFNNSLDHMYDIGKWVSLWFLGTLFFSFSINRLLTLLLDDRKWIYRTTQGTGYIVGIVFAVIYLFSLLKLGKSTEIEKKER